MSISASLSHRQKEDSGPERVVQDLFMAWVSKQGPFLCAPGQGRTWERFTTLGEAAAIDLALGRLAEGHADAVAILAEAGRQPVGNGPYGVWAAGGATGGVKATPGRFGWRLEGQRGFCLGAGVVERAVLSAETPDGTRLFDLDARSSRVQPQEGTWPAVGMAASASLTVRFDGIEVTEADCVGPAGFYTGRVGFWWGSTGVASCWWGGARGLLETIGHHLGAGSGGEHELAAYGSAMARYRAMTETLRWAAAEIDAGVGDLERARRVALVTREVVHEGCTAILAAVAAAGGARPICLDADQSRRSADLYTYLAQHHGGRDTATLGRELVIAPWSEP